MTAVVLNEKLLIWNIMLRIIKLEKVIKRLIRANNEIKLISSISLKSLLRSGVLI